MRKFHEVPAQSISNIMQINNLALIGLSCVFYKKFLNRGDKCAIVNMSSLLGLASNNAFHVYPCSKAFIKYYTEILAEESRNRVDIMYVHPGRVRTGMANFMQSVDICEPSDIVSNTLNSLGQDRNTAGYWMHEFA